MPVIAFMITMEFLTREQDRAVECDFLQRMLLYNICLVMVICGSLEGGKHIPFLSLLPLLLPELSS